MQDYPRDEGIASRRDSPFFFSSAVYHKVKIRIPALVFLVFFLESCAAMPFVTSSMVERKMGKLSAGDTKAQAAEKLGASHALAVFPRGADKFEILIYEFGDFWYHESKFLLFKNDHLIAAQEDAVDLLRFLSSVDVIQSAQFFDARKR